MCQWTSVTYLCGVCEVNSVDHKFERSDCRDVKKGWSCRSSAGPTSNAALFRQDIGKTLCEPCTAQILREREVERRLRTVGGGGADGDSSYVSQQDSGVARRYREDETDGDAELRLNTQYLWDPRYSRPESASASGPSTPSTPSQTQSQSHSASQSDSEDGGGEASSRPESRATDRSAGSETQKSSGSSSQGSQGRPDWGGDRELALHSAKYWD
ncbi:hypothetical protein V8E36_001750 [Tilletia maclaganii]